MDEQHPIDRLAEEFVARRRTGERVHLGEFAERMPTNRDEIEDLLPVVDMLEECLDDPEFNDPPPMQNTDLSLKVFGDYYVVREIGRGGMGVVFEARQLSLDRRVAIKVLPERMLLSERRVVRFQREAQSAARLHHANIVPVFGVGRQRRTHYYVMQYIDGFGLDQMILELRRERDDRELVDAMVEADDNLTAAAGQLLSQDFTTRKLRFRSGGTTSPVGEESGIDDVLAQAEWIRGSEGGRFWFNVAGIGIQVANALQFAHDEGVLHRDVKPSNLILDREGQVWVTDFGLAKLLDKGDLTGTSETIGTLRYMAPEQLAGNYAASSDVYGIGATLYELLTLHPVVTEESRIAQMQQIADGKPIPPRAIDATIPADLETIVLKAIARDPVDRYQSPGDLADDLRCFLHGEPISARPLSRLQRAWRWSRKNPTIARLAVGYVLLTMAFLVALVVGYVEMQKVFYELQERNEDAHSALDATRRELRELQHGMGLKPVPPVDDEAPPSSDDDPEVAPD